MVQKRQHMAQSSCYVKLGLYYANHFERFLNTDTILKLHTGMPLNLMPGIQFLPTLVMAIKNVNQYLQENKVAWEHFFFLIVMFWLVV